MAGSGLYWSRNQSAGSLGTATYRVFGNDSSGNFGVSETRTITINNSAPRIDVFIPPAGSVIVNEPNNQSFNITYTDFENDAVSVNWYVNGSLQASANNANFTFLGNFSQSTQQKSNSLLT
jgi:hypothetical protein